MKSPSHASAYFQSAIFGLLTPPTSSSVLVSIAHHPNASSLWASQVLDWESVPAARAGMGATAKDNGIMYNDDNSAEAHAFQGH